MSTTSLQKTAEVLELAVGELTYIPSPEQRKAKSAFWARFNDNPMCEPSQISLAIALRLSPDNRLHKWWPQPGFREWFQNQDEFRQRVEYLVQLGLDSLEWVLADPKAQASAKVNAVKLLMEVARKMPPKGAVEQFLDQKIAAMDTKQLQEFIQSRMKLVGSTTETSKDETPNT